MLLRKRKIMTVTFCWTATAKIIRAERSAYRFGATQRSNDG